MSTDYGSSVSRSEALVIALRTLQRAEQERLDAAVRQPIPLYAEIDCLKAENLELRIQLADESKGHAEAHGEAQQLREALENMVWQFGYHTVRTLTDNKAIISTGGLSALEEAFEALGWDDPKIIEEQSDD